MLRSKGELQDGETLRQTCGFREEWRIERENAALKLLQEEYRDGAWEHRDDALKAHLKCCAHVFVSGNPALQAGPGQKTRRFQELLYAQQMDRILDNIDKMSPGVVIHDAIMDARGRFQTVLSTGVLCNNNTPREDPRMASQALANLDADLAEWRYRIGLERQRAQEELEKEGERFSTEWSKYEAKLRKDVMKSKLVPEWIPQMDQVSGEQYFLSTKTGRTVKEHPNLLLFKQLIAKQRVRAEELFLVQQSRLQDYIIHLDSRLHERTQEILKEMVRKMHLRVND
ncbi:hypothetical protein BBO99_00004973 [Phytophthora kernoviae]|uniref:Uncharacterized protein n=2 Tax=Phytophthora kernoviae TaxID=325452 RepID=A0A3R7H9E2_9STRA|nr:hypothetical protein G195_006936 [Phytophthora kernoviae 00238/432]KAG2522136.1 hypothetical protein JM16_005955 [Phytophthora kernoviae]KAG2523776.1 hypothetical protein JM18_005639 [Phytophthora kernoviae]RLN37474.1 hypothetical protein BBI17_006218 [Phytophthora kernoviae]RLN79863.1 hypothetical protein BBO99_00004973 [Phytophthora kernoviae]